MGVNAMELAILHGDNVNKPTWLKQHAVFLQMITSWVFNNSSSNS
jgi:hypothetical protein